MTPEGPTDPKGVRIGDVEAEPSSEQPSVQRGQTAALSVRLQYLENGPTESSRYRRLKEFQEYAGEAVVNSQLGGKPAIREHPQNFWPVDSHVVPIVYGDEVYDRRDVWALINGIEDNSEIFDEPEPTKPMSSGTYGSDTYGAGLYYGETATPSPNRYVLTIDIVPLADVDEYDDREELLSDLSPVLNQM